MGTVAEELADELWWLLIVRRMRVDGNDGSLMRVSPPGTICGGCAFVSTPSTPCSYWVEYGRWFCPSCSVVPVHRGAVGEG
jgi:hypothetical protein